MDTKECIEVLKSMKNGNVPSSYSEFCKEYNDKIDEVIKRLQMWEDFKKQCKKGRLYIDVHCEHGESAGFSIKDEMDNFEQKCFPKPEIRKTIEVEVLASNREVINELEKEIFDMANGQSHHKGKIKVVSTRWARE